MRRLKDGWLCRPGLGVICTLVFHRSVIFVFLTHRCGGQPQVVGPSEPIVATVGDDIMLPCHLSPAVDASDQTVEWARPDLNPRFVYVWRDGVELKSKKHPFYVERTSLHVSKLKHGDISLKLSKVKLSDEGTYRCFIPTMNRDSSVQLVVGTVSSLIINLMRTENDEEVVLQCESKGWYPEPEVFWLDGEGNLLSAGPTETVRGPDDLYTVSRRLTVEKSDNFTCRVQQKNINQTRETEIQILDDVFTAPSCAAVHIAVVLSVVGFLLCAAAFVVWCKRRNNKRPNAMHHDNGTEDGTVETDKLVEEQKKMEDRDKEKLKEKEEEQKDIRNMISVLEEKKKKLENSRDKLKSQIEEVEKKMKKNEKKLESLNVPFLYNRDEKMCELKQVKQELEEEKTECEKTLQSTVEILQETEGVIKRLTERKNKVEEQVKEMNLKKRDEEMRFNLSQRS